MIKEDYTTLREFIFDETPTVIGGHQLINQNSRTLLYGYNKDRETLHVYLDDRSFIHIFWYQLDRDISHDYTSIVDIYQIIPDKRLYPECCDFGFCKILKEWGYSLPFTTFNKDREIEQFYGRCK